MEMPTDMQHQAMGYDRTATMFSPDGHLLQVEYAEKTVRLGSSSVGMVCSDGVFIIADKRVVDRLIVLSSSSKVHEIDNNMIASVAGIVSDARILIERAQVISQQSRVTYDSPAEPESVIRDIANMQQQFTQYGGARPFGVSMMIAGVNNGRPQLFTSDVTGNYFSYHANAIGEKDEKIKEILREKYNKEITIKKGVKLVLEIFEEVKGSKVDITKMEMGYITNEGDKVNKIEGEEILRFTK